MINPVIRSILRRLWGLCLCVMALGALYYMVALRG